MSTQFIVSQVTFSAFFSKLNIQTKNMLFSDTGEINRKLPVNCSKFLLVYLLSVATCVPPPPLRQVSWLQPGLRSGHHEEPRSYGAAPTGHPAGGGPAEGGPPLEGTRLQERIHPGEALQSIII